MSDNKTSDLRMLFALFNEIGIIEQLSRTLFEGRLPKGVLVSHFSVLNHLSRLGDGRTPLDIARAFQVPKTTLSHTLSLLEKRGWIEMRPNPADKRSKLVYLTDAGRTFRETAIDSLAPDMAAMADHLNLGDIEAMLPKLAEIRSYLDRARDAAGT
ncbi:MarR family winged helix-turn-helix transcriptional regulator [Pseudosulfitobacter koreensis]|uniref:MarR family transcriptional regulator n=1 Tax=Pseudosulfitobacter koreensis TaxID=2968472 RepID=A0ABT1Z4E9_9RHOB|nr:MarR family transcriptional regulator [Pseudosulfitobacter koreense]MCR8828012.1 MarR family transcriptional regulator [Pseudosulfitobacter koreense]